MNKSKLTGGAIIAGILGFYAWMWVPDYVWDPDKEARSHYLYDAKKVFNTSETRTIGDEEYTQTYTGSCPDLSMQTSKALADSKLTIREVHDLHEEAQRLYDEANRISMLNEALRAAGKPESKEKMPNCPSGNELFN